MRKLNGFSLVLEEPIRGKSVDGEEGEIIDWKFTVVAEGKTKEGLIKFAILKKLDKDTHAIEAHYVEYVNGIPVPDSEYLGHLNEL